MVFTNLYNFKMRHRHINEINIFMLINHDLCPAHLHSNLTLLYIPNMTLLYKTITEVIYLDRKGQQALSETSNIFVKCS